MLLELRAENYTVIDRAAAQFGPGLNLLTGETGAGKSILIDALALLLGGKASSDLIRHGSDKAIVSCVFQKTPAAETLLSNNGIDTEADEILLRREILANGKGRVFVNDQPVTVGLLRQLAPELAQIHAQGETSGAFDQAQQRLLLDRFGGISTELVREAYGRWRETSVRLEELESAEQDRLRMADLWRFQSREIDNASLAAEDEDAQLEGEKRILANAEKLSTAASSAHDLLYESEHAAETTLGAALRHLEELARFDERFREPAQQLAAAKAMVEDVDAEVRDFGDSLDASPERLAEIEDRLAALDRLKRKYGDTLAAVMAFGAEAARQLSEIENRDLILAELRQRQADEAQVYRTAAAKLTDLRRAAGARLGVKAETEINDLAMRVRFEVGIVAGESLDRWAPHGWDEIEYRIATNAGEPLKPLDEIASGGEMSRVMLALKVTVEEEAVGRNRKKKSGVARTLIFDEIDIGIGGRAAEAVGLQAERRFRETQQVLCITHLPQIAAFADQHFLIEKGESKGRTRHLRASGSMDEPERASRRRSRSMLSGATLTETSLRHAENLLESREPLTIAEPG